MENSVFVKRVIDEGFCFIGFFFEIILMMGDKIVVCVVMKEVGVFVVFGSEGDVMLVEEVCKVVSLIGYFVMLKVSGGGGGIGMVCCDNEEVVK